MASLLATLLNSSENINKTSDPTLVIITDSILTPGISLLKEFITSTIKRQDSVILISLEQNPIKFVQKDQIDSNKVAVINYTNLTNSSSSLASTSSRILFNNEFTEQYLKKLEDQVLSSIGKVKIGEKLLVVIDSITRLEEETGISNVYSFLKNILNPLKGISDSRLVTLHHHQFPAVSSNSALLQSDLLFTLLSPSLSSSTIHLTLHPSSLLELFSREYGLSIPLTANAPLDLRLNSFLTSFNSRIFGNPLIRPKKSTEEDERIVMDIGGKNGAVGNVVEWSCRGVNWPLGGIKRGEVKKFLARGLEGMRKLSDGRIEGVNLNKVLRWESMVAVSTQEVIVPLSSSKPVEPPLPFNLSLTESQKLAREDVVLPYLPKEAGVEYVPDAGDDLDDDDPDEDLEI